MSELKDKIAVITGDSGGVNIVLGYLLLTNYSSLPSATLAVMIRTHAIREIN